MSLPKSMTSFIPWKCSIILKTALILKKIANSWLNEGGRLIVGIDLYHENSDSHSWEDKVGTRMLMFKETEWINFFRQAGFNDVTSWRANQSKDWAGTLVLTGKK